MVFETREERLQRYKELMNEKKANEAAKAEYDTEKNKSVQAISPNVDTVANF